MKRLPIIILILGALTAAILPACHSSDDDWEATYKEWRETNEAWLLEQQTRTNPDGSPYYKVIVPEWNPAAYVLIHYFEDPSANEGNLSPMSTSTIDTRYRGFFCNDTPLDSSLNLTSYGPGVFRTKLNQVITGWTIAFETMHVGDTAEIVVPWQWAYGETVTGVIPPYSNLRFNVRLVDIYRYETNAN